MLYRIQDTCTYSYFLLIEFTFLKLTLKKKRKKEELNLFYSPLTPSSVLCRRNQRNRRKSVIPVILDVDCKHTLEHRFLGFLYGRVGNEEGWVGEDVALRIPTEPFIFTAPCCSHRQPATHLHESVEFRSLLEVYIFFLKRILYQESLLEFFFIPYV